jgi:uncharacterized protein YyaL (SSP411 family)
MQRNRLAAQTSPYLLQHAANPVDWHPWDAAALALAKRERRLILLSVGYSACHWCHVMAHESFEDPDTAALMNRLFVNIKVDREERPDLDKIYQLAQQLITQRPGGWPLTMFLTPEDQQPFFGGTYFPPVAGRGMPAFRDVLERVAAYHAAHAPEIREQNHQLGLAFARLAPAPAPADAELDLSVLSGARDALEKSFDAHFGGFGRAPKFPHPSALERLLRHWYAGSASPAPDLKALFMATLTLTRMAEGGIYDQLGGGFARYSVDDFWMIPHFEKMLYDNAQLLALYAQASLATGEPLFARIAKETAQWLLGDMRSPEGGFYSSLDADSEGHEGRFYVWQLEEMKTLLTPVEFTVMAQRFGLEAVPNFDGLWHLHAHRAVDALQVPAGLSAEKTLATARAKLLKARRLRVWPARDEKILTSWNALTIKGLALAGRTLERPEFTAAASDAVDFLRRSVWRDGRLLATSKDGRAHLNAYLDDYAYLADALLELLQTRWRDADLDWACRLLDVLLESFEDRSDGGFFFTAADHETLIHRSKSFADDAIPAGNAVAASVMSRLGYLLGETRYLSAAERALRAASESLKEIPSSHMSTANALEDLLEPVSILVIRGPSADLPAWLREVRLLYAPTLMTFAIPDDAPNLPPALALKEALSGTTAYLCSGTMCLAPVTELRALVRLLTERRRPV